MLFIMWYRTLDKKMTWMSTQMSSAASPRTIATITATAELTAPGY